MRGFNSGNALALDRLTFIRTDGARDALPASVPIAPPSCLLPPLEKRQHHLSVRSCCSTFRVSRPYARTVSSSPQENGQRIRLGLAILFNRLIRGTSLFIRTALRLSRLTRLFACPTPTTTPPISLLHPTPARQPQLPRRRSPYIQPPPPPPKPHAARSTSRTHPTTLELHGRSRSPHSLTPPLPSRSPSQPSFPLLSSAPLDVPPARPSSSPRPWPSQPAISGTPATPPRRTPRPRP